jgi:hypothetical protein
MKKIIYSALIISIFIMCGCTKKSNFISDKEESFASLYPDIEFNTMVILEEDPFSTNMKVIGSEVDLVLVNQSDEQIEFYISDNLDIYYYNELTGQWKNIENKMSYYGGGTIMQPKGSNEITDALAFCWPNLIDNGKPIQIRIVALANTISNTIEKRVGAYFDIILDPFE